MADAIAQAEKSKYERMWKHDSYRQRSPGLRHLQDAMEKLRPSPGDTMVDYGCGTGRVALEMAGQGLDVTAVDIADNCCSEFDGRFVEASLWDLPHELGRHRFGFCADVMEHIPTEKVPAALANIAAHTETTYFQIANFYCSEGNKIGENLHLTVKPFTWWIDEMSDHFEIVSAEALNKHHVFICKSRAF